LTNNDGVVKRMLTRSRTEPSIGSDSAISSLSSGSSSLTRLEYTPQKADSAWALTSSQSTPSTKRRLAPPSPPTLVTPQTRTYGGKSRSFLMPLPITQLKDSFGLDDMHEEDEFEIRESYTDLRTRWGVDNSEDDPPLPSPTISSPVNRNATAPLPSGMTIPRRSWLSIRRP
jgi:hypothetical protein